MPTHGYAARRPNRLVLPVVLGGHAVALAALVLVKTEMIPDNPFKPTTVYPVPSDPPPPPPPPPPEIKEDSVSPRTKSDITAIKPVVTIPTDGPVVPPSPIPEVYPLPGPVGPETILAPPAAPVPPAPPRAADPPAPPKAAPVRVKPRGNPSAWVTNEDYPDAALRGEEQGLTAFRLDVGADGRPTGCAVTGSSGSRILDDAACRLLMRRARFAPGKDADGQAVGGTWASSFRWRIPEE